MFIVGEQQMFMSRETQILAHNTACTVTVNEHYIHITYTKSPPPALAFTDVENSTQHEDAPQTM